MNTTPKISVIVPVYNTEKYLHRCIDSILSQTFTDFELLLIDDGSKDSSGAICDEYAAKDNRVRVFHKENGGVSSARNLGLDNATGEWIAFVDADDWVESGYLYSMLCVPEADLIMSSFQIVDNVEKLDNDVQSKYYAKETIRFFIAKYIHNSALVAPWAKLFKKSLVGSLRFNTKLSLNEDTVFVFEYLSNIQSVYIVEYYGYNYRRGNNDSLSVRPLKMSQYKRVIHEYFLSIKKIERVFGYEGTLARMVHGSDHFAKSLTVLKTNKISFVDRYKQLVDLLEDDNIQEILRYKNNRIKGKRRKLFDFLALYKLYPILYVYIMIRNGLIY